MEISTIVFPVVEEVSVKFSASISTKAAGIMGVSVVVERIV